MYNLREIASLVNGKIIGAPKDNTDIIEIHEGILEGIKFEKVEKDSKNKRDLTTQGEGLKTEEYVLEREVVLKKGEPVTMEDMQKTIQNIFRLGYFKDIKQEFEKNPEDPNKVTLILKLDEQKSGSISGGISYGSVVGLVGNVNIQDNNFRGKSQNLKASFEISSKDERTYELSFSDPWIKGTDRLSFSTSLYKKEIQNSDDSYTEKTGLTVSGGRNLTEKIRIKLGTKLEKVREYDEDENLKNGGDFSIIEIYPSIYYDTRNNYLNATEGEYARLGLVNGLKFGGDYYTTIELELRKYHEFITEDNTLTYRMVTGIASNTTPESQQFYVGGGNSLRGYGNYEFLGEEELYVNIENRYKLNDTIQVVGFFDVGRSWKSFEDFSKLKDIKKSYGFGIRANTPIGPLRFDYGWPLGDKDESNGKFHFNMGQLF
ncbi:MAG: BamA/OMP85 family outer membrane protein [Fusobacteriota bacterium]